MNNFKVWAIGLLAAVLTACGGSGGDSLTGDPNSGVDTPTASASSIVLLANPATLQSASDVPVSITAIVTDDSGGAVGTAQIQITADSSGLLSASNVITDDFGRAVVELTTIDPTNRTINVSGTLAGGQSTSITVDVVGTSIATCLLF